MPNACKILHLHCIISYSNVISIETFLRVGKKIFHPLHIHAINQIKVHLNFLYKKSLRWTANIFPLRPQAALDFSSFQVFLACPRSTTSHFIQDLPTPRHDCGNPRSQCVHDPSPIGAPAIIERIKNKKKPGKKIGKRSNKPKYQDYVL